MFHVLIVDDEPVSQDYLRSVIDWQRLGFELLPPALSAHAARASLETETVHIAILDIFMPGENGVALSTFIAENYPEIAMLAVSSHDDYDYVRQILKNGAHDYILKHRITSGILEQALTAITNKLHGHLPDQSDRRTLVSDWLFHGRPYPSVLKKMRAAITIARINLPKDISSGAGEALVPGILSLLESNHDSETVIISIFREPNFYIIVNGFPALSSETQMQRKLFLNNQKNKNNLRLVYHAEFVARDYPLFGSLGELPRFLDTQIDQMRSSTQPMAGQAGVSLTLARKKVLISALEDYNLPGVRLLIHSALTNGEADAGALLSITKDIAEILISAVQEYQVGMEVSMHNLLAWASKQEPHAIAEQMGAQFEMLINLLQDQHPRYSEYVSSAARLIRERYMDDISLEQLAERLAISQSYLSRLFKKETGSSFVDYLNKTRVEAAQAHLRNEKSIKETAKLCGFNQYNYFLKVFKSYTGLTPAEYLNE